ncbi:MAG TPA: segregation/condensation protein A [bacterium]|mgnify:CR=1 FL=1|nr:segregation/condensation protein A [bacterium]
MGYNVKLEKFEGPLDLLLQLIEQADLDITELSISTVAEQFMNYLSQVEEKNSEELADFLVVAAKLLLIKSKALLPNVDLESVDDGIDLAQQLKIYREYYEASQKMAAILATQQTMFFRDKIPLDLKIIFNPPKNITTQKLKEMFLAVLKEIEPIVRLPRRALLRAISIKEKIENIRTKILAGLSLRFKELVGDSKSKTEIIVTFLSVLELVKQKTVTVTQEEMFEEIIIEKIC